MKRAELIENIRKKRSFLCVGLDPDIKKLPKHLLNDDNPLFAFNRAIIDATAQYAVAYKPNLAFYESIGVDGWIALEKTIKYIKANYPDQFIIADAKRGDIGNTSQLYARSFFEHLDVDAVTVAPYMGTDSVAPFLGYDGKWVIILALTSNSGSNDFQLFEGKNGKRLFEHVLETSAQWGSEDEIMYVVGATQSNMFANIRRLRPNSFLLVPGIGAQGGSLEDVAKYGMNDDCGLLVNSSRSIIYASSEIDFADAAGKEAKRLADEMAVLLEKHGII